MSVRRTSSKAYWDIRERGLLTGRRLDVYEILFDHGPLTANEIFQRWKGSTSITQANTHARLNEMREMGCVEEVGTRVCSITGNEVILWDVTPDLPKPLKKPPRHTCPTCEGKGYWVPDGGQCDLFGRRTA